MTSSERIMGTLNRTQIDRLPADLWATPEVMQSLKTHFRCETDDEVFTGLGVDKILWVMAPYQAPGANSELMTSLTEAWEVERKEVNFGAGSYMEIAKYPLADITTVAEAEKFAWPDPDLFNYAALAPQCIANERWVRMLFFISLFELYCSIRPMDKALMDLYTDIDLAQYIIERIADVQLQYIEKSLQSAGDHIEVVYISDDMGMQDRQLIPTDKWEFYFHRHMGNIVDLIHSYGKLAFYHTDGSAPEIVDRLVDLGIDVLNPVQHRCPGMDRDRLAKLYGDRIVFHGGVENQQVLPLGTPADVRKEVMEDMRTLGKGGGYIVASCHMLQAGTPIDNILALYDTVLEHGHRFF
jgi:uroporphyrinogen decarboxylase